MRRGDAEPRQAARERVAPIRHVYCTIDKTLIPRLGFSNSRNVLNFCMWNFFRQINQIELYPPKQSSTYKSMAD